MCTVNGAWLGEFSGAPGIGLCLGVSSVHPVLWDDSEILQNLLRRIEWALGSSRSHWAQLQVFCLRATWGLELRRRVGKLRNRPASIAWGGCTRSTSLPTDRTLVAFPISNSSPARPGSSG